jgi:hypothetical protein
MLFEESQEDGGMESGRSPKRRWISTRLYGVTS